MMRSLVFSMLVGLALWAAPAAAQDRAYIQIEARPSLSAAQSRLRDYSAELADVNGFDLGRGWYGIALGPYSREEAASLLRSLRARGLIPSDSYVEEPGRYGQRIWPIGAGPAGAAPTASPPDRLDTPAVQSTDETPREARAAEARLNRVARQDVQIALKWAGFYDAAIDGAFGSGTRAAMRQWQRANGYPDTGILTTAQRDALFEQYNSVLDGMDMQTVRDTRAGIRIDLPLGAVALDRYESPFAIFAPTGTVEQAQVLLISQPGDRERLGGLYEIMQTLQIVPREGERELGRNGFTLTGRNDRIVSHSEARLSDGAIKGFTLVWPAGDEERRTRILAALRSSFEPIDGVLDPAAVTEDAQSVDLVAGLKIRQPKLTASGIFVDRQGHVATTSAAVASCGRITLNGEYEARVLASDSGAGVAVLAPAAPLAPGEVARFRDGTPRIASEIAVSGYSFGGVLSTATLTFGRLADLHGLDGEEGINRLAIDTMEGDAGGPVLDDGGAVVGMLIPRDAGGRRLPDDVGFAVKADRLRSVLEQAGIVVQTAEGFDRLDPVDLTERGVAMTALVSCWE
ncbi:serine protease [Marivita sp. GX14005]|uniref:serine protease n=1 Tax=Marivita sp. GX14005 TaxID=2942276 RepID=UPI0020186744|nr:serine protease [Marivita sp. GX14005]MCL3882422.1 serine protease [Marivita sp. GX14005]